LTLAGGAVVVISAVTDLMTGLFFNPKAESFARPEQVAPAACALLVKDVIAARAKTEVPKLANGLARVISFLPRISHPLLFSTEES
jgi:hypothetical protein